MRIYQRTLICVVSNCISLIPVIFFVLIYSELKFGPDESLNIIGIKINDWTKYIGIVVVNSILKVIDVFINDIGSPNLAFSIFNPSQTIVYGFTKNQLQILANLMWFSNSFSSIFRTMIMVSRIDISIICMLFQELASVFTIRYLLNNKNAFIPYFDSKEDEENGLNFKVELK